MRGPLPVYVDDPVARLRVVRQAMDGLKESKQAVGAEVLAGVQGFAPPTVLAQASRLNFSTRLFNLIVTNVPGPQFPLYMRRARRMRPLPGRVPARRPRAGDRDHELQRRDELRPARRLRRAAGHRRGRARYLRDAIDELQRARPTSARRRHGVEPQRARRGARSTHRRRRAGRAQYPSANFASSLIWSGDQGGVKIIADSTQSTPSSSETNSSICSATIGPIGQPGVVSV